MIALPDPLSFRLQEEGWSCRLERDGEDVDLYLPDAGPGRPRGQPDLAYLPLARRAIAEIDELAVEAVAYLSHWVDFASADLAGDPDLVAIHCLPARAGGTSEPAGAANGGETGADVDVDVEIPVEIRGEPAPNRVRLELHWPSDVYGLWSVSFTLCASTSRWFAGSFGRNSW